MRKLFAIILSTVLMVTCLCGCEYDVTTSTTGNSYTDNKTTISNANTLQGNQPTPSDIEYSLERYNLIRRAYWVNGMRDKANMLPCEVEKPLGYIVLFTEGGGIIGSFVVDGKVSSLNSYLTPDSEYYEQEYYSNGASVGTGNKWLADVDGSYGENDSGIFFFTVQGNYIEWTGTYLYSDIPMTIENPVVQFEIAD